MTYLLFLRKGVELVLGQTGSNLSLKRLAPCTGIHDSKSADSVDSSASLPDSGNQPIQHKTGVHAGADDRHPCSRRRSFEFLSDLGILQKGKRQFLARRDHREALFDRL